MSKKYTVTIALTITITLFITACGLQGDLYIPDKKAASEETTATPARAQSTDSESADNETAEDKKSNQSSEQAP